MPDLRNRFLQGNNNGGQVIEAGLPNIIGNIISTDSGEPFVDCDSASCNGALWLDGFRNWSGGSDSNLNAGAASIHFNASRSNAIYGRSNTVQPPAVTVRYYIRAK